MAHTIAMAGKGGTGKTTLAALIIRILVEQKRGSVLGVDADPNSNLAECLGLKQQSTVADILDEIAKKPDSIPAGMPKDRFIEYRLQEAVLEGEGFDILVMGRPEGPGCYCYVNNALRGMMQKLIKDYDFVIIDNEAGLEHLSRRTTRSADSLVIVSDNTKVGLKSAQRISALAKELEISIKNEFLLLNRSDSDISDSDSKGLAAKYLGFLEYDPEIQKAALNGNSLVDISTKAVSYLKLKTLGERIWQ